MIVRVVFNYGENQDLVTFRYAEKIIPQTTRLTAVLAERMFNPGFFVIPKDAIIERVFMRNDTPITNAGLSDLIVNLRQCHSISIDDDIKLDTNEEETGA